MRSFLSSSWPGLTQPSTGSCQAAGEIVPVRSLRETTGSSETEGCRVDGRVKPGHDDGRVSPSSGLATASREPDSPGMTKQMIGFTDSLSQEQALAITSPSP